MKIMLRFYGELNDHLPRHLRSTEILYEVRQRTTVKDTIESLGPPHTEVDLVLVDGVSRGFEYLLNGGESLSVLPMFRSLDITTVTQVRDKALRNHPHENLKFAVDVNLGRLARALRMLGFDVFFDKNLQEDRTLAAVARTQER